MYAGSFTYWPNGALQGDVLGGTALLQQYCQNSLLQTTGARATAPAGGLTSNCANSGDLLNLAIGYGSAGSNNGNVTSEQIQSSSGFNATQAFTQDAYNRLQMAKETVGGSQQWQQAYGYDTFGNRWVTGYTPGTATPSASSNYGTTGAGRNQLSGVTYDAVGNQQRMAGIALQYDGESRQTTSTVNGVTTNYAYDGEGRRVQKTTGTAATVYVYDATGNEVAEYSTAAAAVSGTEYVTTDHLGSTRLVTNASGTAVACHDYLPFGEELLAPESGRSGCYASVDGVTQKFTGKERDAETAGSATPSGLDYFGARYMSSAQGRWTSPDPSNLGVDIYLPQTWNRYNYGVNNPLAIADANGLWPFYVHDRIVDEAFPGMSKQDLKTLKDASWNTDYAPGQQDPSRSYMHGMSDGGGTVFWGGGNDQHDRTQADQYIDDQTSAAQKAQADWVAQGHTGLSPKALTAFGNALHTVTDRTSPAHKGEQPWANKPWWHYTTLGHFFNEALRSPSQVQSSDSAARSLFQTTFGSMFDWVFFKNPCGQTSATDSQGNSTGVSGCQ